MGSHLNKPLHADGDTFGAESFGRLGYGLHGCIRQEADIGDEPPI
jgi:hypothetical protein